MFEDHLPELLPLYKARPRRGDLVCRRDGSLKDPLKDIWQVQQVKDGMATCIKPGDAAQALPARATEHGVAQELVRWAVDELLVLREFGEPIFPSLVPVDAVANGPADAPWHTLIEADNYHALQLLEYLYAGQVDCIYIDPPYNTGARDWKYNNRVGTDSEPGFACAGLQWPAGSLRAASRSRCCWPAAPPTRSATGRRSAIARPVLPAPSNCRCCLRPCPYPIVEVAINGRPGYRFLFDTGAMGTVIFRHPGTADLPLSFRGEIAIGGLGDGARPTAQVAPGVALQLGPLTLRDVTVLVLPVARLALFGSPDLVFIDGIIGNDLWTRFGVEVDAAAGRMRLHRLGTTDLGSGARSAALAVRRDHLFVPVRVALGARRDPVTVDLLLDSGAAGALYLVTDPVRGLVPPEGAVTIEGRGMQGPSRAIAARSTAVEVADVRWLNVPTDFGPQGAGSRELGAGLIGVGLLSQTRWAVDVGQSRLWLVPGDAGERRFEDGSFGLATAAVADRLLALMVRAQGPAANAGLQAGDELISLDGSSITGSQQAAVDAALRTRRTATLCWRRADEVRCGALARAAP